MIKISYDDGQSWQTLENNVRLVVKVENDNNDNTEIHMNLTQEGFIIDGVKNGDIDQSFPNPWIELAEDLNLI